MNALSVASLGYGYGVQAMAGIGFLGTVLAPVSRGGGGGFNYNHFVKDKAKPDTLALQIAREDVEVTEFIQALMATGILDDKVH
jgi:hypothetical protein